MSRDYEDDTPEPLDEEVSEAIDHLIDEPPEDVDLEVEAELEENEATLPHQVYPPSLDGPATEPDGGYTPMPTGLI